MRVLLTGFEPFGTSTVNPSEEVVRAVVEQKATIESSLGIQLATAVLPVDLVEGPRVLLQLIREQALDAVLCMGEARGRSVISIEQLATNMFESTVPDNAERLLESSQPVVPDGPAAYFSTLPLQAIVARVRQAGIGAEISRNAGTCLCNQVLYTALHDHAERGCLTKPIGFIHLPWLPEQVAASQQSSEKPRAIASMSLDTMTRAVVAVLETVRDELKSPAVD